MSRSHSQFKDGEPAPGDGREPRVVVVSAGGGRTVWWLMAMLLAVIATALIARWDAPTVLPSTWAQATGAGGGTGAGARGIYAFTGQLTSKTFGLFMMDVDTGTIWCYELDRGPTGELQMKLVAARSWIFDRYLEEFNCAEPTPGAVHALIRQQQSHRQRQVEIEREPDGELALPAPAGDRRDP